MNSRKSTSIPFLALWLTVLLLIPAIYASVLQDPSPEEIVARGKAALEAGNYEDALAWFRRGMSRADSSNWEVRFLFYSGLTYQKRVEEQRTSLRKKEWIEQAERHYLQVLERDPRSATTMNNLARLYEAAGRTAEASRMYERALQLEQSPEPALEKNYADFLAKNGQWEEAANRYEALVKKEPQSTAPHKTLVERYLKIGSPRLIDYLWELVEQGQVLRTEEASLAALEAREWEPELVDQLFTILAVSLSQRYYAADSFLEGQAAERLQHLTQSSNASIARCAEELVRVHGREDLQPQSYPWWSKRGDPEEEAPRGMWPRDAFRELVRSLGQRAKQVQNFELAERYFRLAADLAPDEVDPLGFRELVDLYVEQNRMDELRLLAEEYEPQLFMGKGTAYRESHLAKIFDYHRTLAELYAYLDQWGHERDPNSAIFQLSRAWQTARLLDEQSAKEEVGRVEFTPQLANLLAQGYQSTGQEEKSSEVRLSAAEMYLQDGNDRKAELVLAPLEDSEAQNRLTSSHRARYTRAIQLIEAEGRDDNSERMKPNIDQRQAAPPPDR